MNVLAQVPKWRRLGRPVAEVDRGNRGMWLGCSVTEAKARWADARIPSALDKPSVCLTRRADDQRAIQEMQAAHTPENCYRSSRLKGGTR